MENEASAHEKGIEEAVRVFYGDSVYPLKAEILKDMEGAIAAYLQVSGLVLVPREPFGWARENFVFNFSKGPEKPENATSNPNEWMPVFFPSPLNTIKQEDKGNG